VRENICVSHQPLICKTNRTLEMKGKYSEGKGEK
jgi:hypothetical protein